MEYQVEEVSPVKRKVSVQVPVEEVHAAISATVALYRRDVDVKGFRKGKVPSSVIEGKYRKKIIAEATTDLVNLHINEIMGELKVTPLSGIDFDGGELVRDQAFDYVLGFEVMPEFVVPSFEGLEVEEETPEVDDKEVEAVFERMRSQLAELEPIDEEREPQDGEIAVIDFKALKDGEVFENFAAENFELPLGEGQTLVDFENLVKSLKPGAEDTKEVTFPEDFLNPELAGKTFDMQVKLKSIKKKVLPEVNDDLAQKAGGFANVAQMREAVINSYTESRKQLYKSNSQKELLDKLLKQVDFQVPESLVEKNVERMLSETIDRLERQGKGLQALGKSIDDLKEEFKPQAEDLARSEVMLLAVAKQESLNVDDRELDFYFQQLAARTGQDFTQLKKYHIENNLMYAVRDRLLADKAMELMYSKAEIKLIPAKSGDADGDKEETTDSSEETE